MSNVLAARGVSSSLFLSRALALAPVWQLSPAQRSELTRVSPSLLPSQG